MHLLHCILPDIHNIMLSNATVRTTRVNPDVDEPVPNPLVIGLGGVVDKELSYTEYLNIK